ncbi:MAG: polyketide synthase [Gammaproteobacteria bacterium]|nr:polyketide synthase [Gammaproteobacteria bacterium]
MFEPIAIIAHSGIFPGGANDAETLYSAINDKKILLDDVREHFQRVNLEWVLAKEGLTKDRTWGKKGGYIHNFEQFIHPDEIDFNQIEFLKLDRIYQWLLFLWSRIRKQLNEKTLSGLDEHTAIILGNLAFPTISLSKIYEHLWLTKNKITPYFSLPEAMNRFQSGLPAQLLADVIHVNPYTAYCIEAACASSLFAIKGACDYLQANIVNVAIAGGISCYDDLYIHMGFAALNALSKSGQSRPLDKRADGLIPAEGAGIIVLKRLQDALDNDDTIYGIIRGASTSNEGKGKGYLVPSEVSQTKTIKSAYELSGIDPASISWIEVHATGTPVGDTKELISMAEVFKHDLDIGAN